MTLYIERGFEQTTVAEIAERAGLTERTFFRHFDDKREVLFGGAGQLQQLIVGAVIGAPATATPLQAVIMGLDAAGLVFQEHAERSRLRQSVIDANAELQARELSKLAALASAISDALRARGVATSAASVAAEAGIVVFKTAFERWIYSTDGQDWTHLIRASLTELKTVVTDAGG